MRKNETKTLLTLVISSLTGALAIPSQAQTFTQNFNTSSGGTFLSDWNQNGPNAPNFYQDTTGGGLGGSNAVALTSNTNDATAIFRNTAFNLRVGTTVTVSAYFRDQQIGANSNAAIAAFQIGFGLSAGDGSNDVHSGTAFNDTSGDSVDTPSLMNAVTARVENDGSIEFQTILNGNTTGSNRTAAASLTAGNWYYLTAAFTVSSTANAFSGTASLFNSDSDGDLGTQIETTSAAALTNSIMWDDSTTYAGFRAAGQTTGVNGAGLVDNFSASSAPEPGSAVLLLGAGALLTLVRKRRRTAVRLRTPDPSELR
jgi:PEP-CTERM motif